MQSQKQSNGKLYTNVENLKAFHLFKYQTSTEKKYKFHLLFQITLNLISFSYWTCIEKITSWWGQIWTFKINTNRQIK